MVDQLLQRRKVGSNQDKTLLLVIPWVRPKINCLCQKCINSLPATNCLNIQTIHTPTNAVEVLDKVEYGLDPESLRAQGCNNDGVDDGPLVGPLGIQMTVLNCLRTNGSRWRLSKGDMWFGATDTGRRTSPRSVKSRIDKRQRWAEHRRMNFS